MTFVSIHDTARVHETARLGHGVIIGPNVTVGAHVTIGAYSVIGGVPEHAMCRDEREWGGRVFIAEQARLHEHVTVHGGVEDPTVIGKEVWIFNHCHVAHDCVIEPHAVLCAGALLGGHSRIMQRATVGAGAVLHPWAIVGPYGYLGAASYLRWCVEPGDLHAGNPAQRLGRNDIGLERAGLTYEQVSTDRGEFQRWKAKAKERFRKSIAASSPAS